MAIEIKKSHEGRFHDWAKVPQGQEIPMSKIKQGERRTILPSGKRLASPTTLGTGTTRAEP
jgi:hypothetical protein